jgi:ferredoxin-NADP reductase
LLLIGTGTGLAPLMGVLRDALTRGHSGPIRIYHGARNLDGLYLWQALLKLAKRHLNVHLEGWVVEPPLVSSHGIRVGRLGREVLDRGQSLEDAEIYLCGNPDLVRGLKKFAYLRGAALSRIHADAFAATPAEQVVRSHSPSATV